MSMLLKPGSRLYYINKRGNRVYYDDIGREIAKRAKSGVGPDLRGVHIFEQLKYLGIYEDFEGGESPHGLPYSFTDSWEERKHS